MAATRSTILRTASLSVDGLGSSVHASISITTLAAHVRFPMESASTTRRGPRHRPVFGHQRRAAAWRGRLAARFCRLAGLSVGIDAPIGSVLPTAPSFGTSIHYEQSTVNWTYAPISSTYGRRSFQGWLRAQRRGQAVPARCGDTRLLGYGMRLPSSYRSWQDDEQAAGPALLRACRIPVLVFR